MAHYISTSSLKIAKRGNSGNILLLGAAVMVVLAVISINLMNLQFIATTYLNDSSSVHSAALAAADDISKIIMNDERYGYVSYQGSAFGGPATRAGDGLPTEVLSVNSIVAAARFEDLVAHAIASPDLVNIADEEWLSQKEFCQRFNHFIQSALYDSENKFVDLNNQPVSPFRHARRLLEDNLRSRLKKGEEVLELKNFTITLGYLEQSTSSGVAIPSEPKAAMVSVNQTSGSDYAAFVDIPVAGHSYYFAELPSRSCFAKVDYFKQSDQKRLCSAIKIDVDVRIHNLTEERNRSSLMDLLFPKGFVHHSVCAKAHAGISHRPSAVLTLDLREGVPSEVSHLSDLLSTKSYFGRQTMITTSSGGDLGLDSTATIAPSALKVGGQNPLPSQIFADAIGAWLNHIGSKANLDSTIAAMRSPFANIDGSNDGCKIFTYELNTDGQISAVGRPRSPFDNSVRLENQTFAFCPFQTASGEIGLAYVQNRTSKRGIERGGRHAGEPLVADAANWRELDYYGGSTSLAMRAGVGEKATRTRIHGSQAFDECSQPIPGSVAPVTAVFYNSDGSALRKQPRTDYYCGGEIANISMASCERLVQHGFHGGH